jgi:DNA-binding PadR family transcriptional regulator
MKRKSDGSAQIRLTTTSFAMLALLDQFGPATSYDIKGAIEHSIENFWNVPHTTAYEEPARLASAGYLSVEEEPGGRRRRVYSLTARGRAALREWASEPAAPPQLRDELVLKVFAGADPDTLAPERIIWHEGKLAELEAYLAAVPDEERLQASRNTLLAGIAYHQAMLEVMDPLRQEPARRTS